MTVSTGAAYFFLLIVFLIAVRYRYRVKLPWITFEPTELSCPVEKRPIKPKKKAERQIGTDL